MNNGYVYADKINADKIKTTLKLISSSNDTNHSHEVEAKSIAISLIEFYVFNYPHSSQQVWHQKIEEGKVTIGKYYLL